MIAQPIKFLAAWLKTIVMIFVIGLGRVKGLCNFMAACRNVAHHMGMPRNAGKQLKAGQTGGVL